MTSNATERLISSEPRTSRTDASVVGCAQKEPHALYGLLVAPSRWTKVLRLAVCALLLWPGARNIWLYAVSLLDLRIVVHKDFIQEWVMARALLTGTNPYKSVNALALRFLGTPSQFPHPSPHPPSAILLFWPFGALDYAAAVSLWLGLSLALLALCVWLLGRCFGTPLHPLSVAAIVVMLMAWYPFSQDLGWGQLNVFMLTLATGALLALGRRRPAVAGLLIGLALLLKIVYWPFALLFLVRREWRAVRMTIISVAAGYLVAGVILGPVTIFTYFRDVLPEVSALYQTSIDNVSIWTVGTRLFSGTGSPMHNEYTAPPLIAAPPLAAAVSVILPLMVMLVAAWVAQRMTFEGAFALFATAIVLVSPLTWEHYLALLVIPMAYSLRRLASARFPSGPTNAALLVAVLLAVPPGYWVYLAGLAAGYRVTGPGIVLPFGVALASLGSVVAMLALGTLVIWLDLRLDRHAAPDLASGTACPPLARSWHTL